MCTRVRCSDCGKPSFVGCGRHVEQVLGDVPRESRCKCNEHQQTEQRSGSILDRLFSKG